MHEMEGPRPAAARCPPVARWVRRIGVGAVVAANRSLGRGPPRHQRDPTVAGDCSPTPPHHGAPRPVLGSIARTVLVGTLLRIRFPPVTRWRAIQSRSRVAGSRSLGGPRLGTGHRLRGPERGAGRPAPARPGVSPGAVPVVGDEDSSSARSLGLTRGFDTFWKRLWLPQLAHTLVHNLSRVVPCGRRLSTGSSTGSSTVGAVAVHYLDKPCRTPG